MEIIAQNCSKNDDRLSVTIFKDDIVLRVVGFDELPHRMRSDNMDFDRIDWTEFHRLLTTPNVKVDNGY